MSSEEWHHGWEPADIARRCHVELIGGEKDIAYRAYVPLIGEHIWYGSKSSYIGHEVRRWRYIPEPPKAPTPPSPRYEMEGGEPLGKSGTVAAILFILAGVIIMVGLLLDK